MAKAHRLVSFLSAIFLIFTLSSTALGADRFWVGAGNWSNAANWSATSGGAGGAGAPGATDVARIEGGGNITLDVAVNVGGIDIAATYGGTITQGSLSLTVGTSNFYQAGADFSGGTGTITFSGMFSLSGGSFTSTSGTLTAKGDWLITGAPTFNSNGGLVVFQSTNTGTRNITAGSAVFNQVTFKGYDAANHTISGSLDVAGTLTLDMTGYAGHKLNGGTILARSNIVVASPNFGTGSSGAGSATIKLCGAGNQTIEGNSAGRLPNVTVDKSTGAVILTGNVVIAGSLSWVEGDLDARDSTLVLAVPNNSTQAITPGPFTYNNVTFKGWGQSSVQTVLGTMEVGGNLELGMTAYSGNKLNGGIIQVQGNVRMASDGFGSASWGPGNATVRLTGALDQTILGDFAGCFPNVEVAKPSGELVLSGVPKVAGNWTWTSGGLSPGSATLVFAVPYGTTQTIATGSEAYGNVTVRGWGLSKQVLLGTMAVSGSLVLDTVAYSGAQLNGGVIAASGDVTLLGDGFGVADGGPGTGTIRLAGSGIQTLTATGVARFPTLDLASSGTVVYSGTIHLGADFIHTSGAVNPNGATMLVVGRLNSKIVGDAIFGNLTVSKGPYGWSYNVDVDGAVTVQGALGLTEGKMTMATGSSIAVGGDLTFASLNTSFTAGTSTVAVNGSAAQAIDFGGKSPFNVSVANVSAPVTFASSFSVLAGGSVSAAAGASLKFAASATFGLGKLAWIGTTPSPITLRSTSEGQAWKLIAAPYQFVRFVDVKDSDASSGPAVTALYSADQGGNLNWNFGQPSSVEITTSAQSTTSPAWVEGDSEADVTSVSVAVNNGAAFGASRLSPVRWYASNAGPGLPPGIVLSPAQATNVEVATANEFGENSSQTKDITWTPTDLVGKSFSTDTVKIRKGDSLLLTATGIGTTLEIDGDGGGIYEKSGVPAEKFPHLYGGPAGTFVATARIDGNVVGSLTIVVISVDLQGPIACEVGYQRTKDVLVLPATENVSVTFVANDPLNFVVSLKENTATGARLYLKPMARGTPLVLARLGGAAGPAIFQQELDEFTLDIPALLSSIIDSGTNIGGTTLTMRPLIPNVQFDFDMFAHTSTFEGGATHLSVNTSDTDPLSAQPLFKAVFDPDSGETLGSYSLTLEVPSTEDMYCFNIRGYDGEYSTGITSNYNVNGHTCKVRPEQLTLCVGPEDCTGETGPLFINVAEGDGRKILIKIIPHEPDLDGPEFKFGDDDCKKTTTDLCIAGRRQVVPDVVAGRLVGDFDVKITTGSEGDDQVVFGNVIHVRECCECESESKCMCVNETVPNALKVTLTSTSGSSHAGEFVIRIKDKGGRGPTFEDGTRTYTFTECPAYKEFTIKSGDLQGEFEVLFKEGSKEEEHCGWLCVYKTPNQPDVMELDFGEPHPNPSPSFPFKGVVCGAGANTVITPLPEKDVNGVARWEKRVYTDPITADQWFGTVDHGVPDSQMPNSNLNPDKKGHKFKEIKDDCGNKVELYCHNDRFKVFYTDCTGKSYLVAVCEFEFGLNKWEAHIHECPHLGKKAFATIYVKNLNRRNHLQFIQYTFDTCTHDRTRRYIKNFDTTPIEETAEPWKDGQTQPSEDGGVSDFRPPDGFLD